jgi:hypothetical protein
VGLGTRELSPEGLRILQVLNFRLFFIFIFRPDELIVFFDGFDHHQADVTAASDLTTDQLFDALPIYTEEDNKTYIYPPNFR